MIIKLKIIVILTIFNQYYCVKKTVDADWELIKNEPVIFLGKTILLENIYEMNFPEAQVYYEQALLNRSFKYIFLMIYYGERIAQKFDMQFEKMKELCEKIQDAVTVIWIYTKSRIYLPYAFNIKEEIEETCKNLDQSIDLSLKIKETLLYILNNYLKNFPVFKENSVEYGNNLVLNTDTNQFDWEKFNKLNKEILKDEEAAVNILYKRVIKEFPRENDILVEDLRKKIEEAMTKGKLPEE